MEKACLGLLADKFNRYKLFLIGSVACCALFHTLLLPIDARILPEQTIERTIRETRAELLCSRTDSVVRFSNWTFQGTNCSKSWITKEWETELTPSECVPLPCYGHGKLTKEMRVHFPHGNNTPVNLQSDSLLSIELVFGTVGLDVDECSASVIEVRVEDMDELGHLSCYCPVSCPLTIRLPPEPINEHELNLTRAQKQVEKSNHNRGFWIYFFFRICASGALATSFSM